MRAAQTLTLALALCQQVVLAQTTPRAIYSFTAPAFDGNSQPTTYSEVELKIVPKGAASSATALIKLLRPVVIGTNEIDIASSLATLPPADYDVWSRLHNPKGWSGSFGPSRFTVPLSGPQAAAPPIPKTTPLKPQGISARVEILAPPPTPEPPPPAAVVTVGLFTDTELPAVLEASDLAAYELGVRFRASVPGRAHGVRFYRGPRNAGVHEGHLWSSTGVLLATCQFSEETVTGWQYARFAAPVSVTADTTYTVSYWCPQGRYSVTINAFGAEKRNGNLTVPAATATLPNGVFRAGAGTTAPTQGFQASNYWVDVIFESAVTSTPPGTPPPVTLHWDPPVFSADGSTLSDLAGYCLVRDGLCEPMGLVTEWGLNLLPGTYRFSVVAVDTRGNESVPSNEIEVRI